MRRRRARRRAGRPAARGRRVDLLGLRAARRADRAARPCRRRARARADRPVAFAAVRLCDVAPDGSSALIARGVLNLTHRDGHDRVVPLVPGEPVSVRVPMQSTAYAIPAGHGLRRRRLADLLAVDLAVAGARDADRRGGPAGAAGAGRSPLDAALRRFGPPESAAGLTKEMGAAGATGRSCIATSRPAQSTSVPVDRPRAHARRERDGAGGAQRRPLPAGRGRPALGGSRRRGGGRAGRGDWRTRVVARGEMTCTPNVRRHDVTRRLRGAGRRSPGAGRTRSRGTADDGRTLRGPGTRTRRSRGANTTGSSAAPGNTPAGARS